MPKHKKLAGVDLVTYLPRFHPPTILILLCKVTNRPMFLDNNPPFCAILVVLIPNNIMVTLRITYAISWSKNKQYINHNTKCKTKWCIMCQYMYQCKRYEMYVKNQRNKNYTNYEISPVSENSWGLRDEEAIGELRVGKNNWVTQLLNKIIFN